MRGETVFVDGIPVENVLVRPGDHSEEADVSVPAGVVVAYTLAFPSSYAGSVRRARVTVRGQECEVVGFSDHARFGHVFAGAWDHALCPWDMLVPVRLCEGEMTADVAIFKTSTTYDELGRPVRERIAVFEGKAQARRAATSADGEEVMPDGSSRAVETWFFVVPWRDGFSSLRPETTSVEMAGIEYDVISVEDVGASSSFLSVKAVRRG